MLSEKFGTAPVSARAAGECVTWALFGSEADFTSKVRPSDIGPASKRALRARS